MKTNPNKIRTVKEALEVDTSLNPTDERRLLAEIDMAEILTHG